MERSDSFKIIIDYALNKAISDANLDIVERCLSSGTSVTLQIIEKCKPEKKYYIDSDSEDEDNDGDTRRKKIFKLLLEHNPELIINDVNFIIESVLYHDKDYIQAIVDAGFNGDHNQSAEILKKIISSGSHLENMDADKLKILLSNRFCQHIQPLLMYCITDSDERYLSSFIKHGANCYAVLHDLHTYISSYGLINYPMGDNIKLFLRNVYNIKMLTEPIFKYFLIKSVNHDVYIPIELFVGIFEWYVSLDYKYINDIEIILKSKYIHPVKKRAKHVIGSK